MIRRPRRSPRKVHDYVNVSGCRREILVTFQPLVLLAIRSNGIAIDLAPELNARLAVA